jgi:peptidoglycan hydrolase CwlO-like protein
MSTKLITNIMTQTSEIDTTGNKIVLDAIEKLDGKIEKLESKVDNFNEKFDNYQKASQSVVNLAFGLIASATIVTLAQAIFRR